MMKLICSLSISMLFLMTSLCGQSDKRMQFFPASATHFAGVNVYSTTSGALKQYYVQDDTWTINNHIPSPDISIAGGNYRMEYAYGGEGVYPSLFVYSANTGEFQFLYLKDGHWTENELLPSGKVQLTSMDMRMTFTHGSADRTAFIAAYDTSGKAISLLEVVDGGWSAIDYFPALIE